MGYCRNSCLAQEAQRSFTPKPITEGWTKGGDAQTPYPGGTGRGHLIHPPASSSHMAMNYFLASCLLGNPLLLETQGPQEEKTMCWVLLQQNCL